MSLVNADNPAAKAVPAPTANPRREALLADFIGTRAATYLAHYRRIERADPPAAVQAFQLPRRTMSWHWAAFLVTIPWLFYRKMYLGGIVLVILPVLFDHIAPGSLFFGSGFMIAICTGLYAKSWYLGHAVNKIDKATETFPTLEQHTAYLRRAGGVSIPGAVFGALTQGITVFLALRDLLQQ